jgi:DNA-binding XRE family transcriptional regulator
MHITPRRKRRGKKSLTAKGWKPGRPSSWYGGSSRRGSINAEQFRWERKCSGLSREGAAELLGVGRRTIAHWETGQTAPSYAAFKLLRVYRQGEFIDPAWSGYRLVRGVLVSPEGREFRPHDMGWMSLLLSRIRLAREVSQERDRLRAALAARESDAENKVFSEFSGVQFQATWQGAGTGLGWGVAPSFSGAGLPPTNRGVSETERIAGEAVQAPQPPRAATLPKAGVAALQMAGGAA